MTFQFDNPQNTISHNNDGDYAYQDVLFDTPKTGSDIAFTAPGTYSFSITFDQGGQNGTDFIAAGGETFTNVVDFLNNYFQVDLLIPATALMHEGRLRIISPTRGTRASVLADDSFSGYLNRFFTDMDEFDGFERGHGVPLAAYQEVLLSAEHFTDDVALVAGTYTADVIINGITSNIVITVDITRAFSDLTNDISQRLSNGWCEFFRDRFIVHSNAGGPGTTVDIIDTDLFSSITDFASIEVAVPGEANPLEVPHITMRPSTNVAPGGTFAADTDGNVSIEGGITTGDGGSVEILGGTIGFVNPNVIGAEGGSVTLRGGDASNGGDENVGGAIHIFAGPSRHDFEAGAIVEIEAGRNFGTGDGGPVIIRGGHSDSQVGGNVEIYSGSTDFEVSGSIALFTGATVTSPLPIKRLEINSLGGWDIDGTQGIAGQAIVSQGSDASPIWASVSSAQPIAGMIVGTPPPGGIVLNFVAVTAFTIPENFTNSQAASQIAATGSTTFDVAINGTPFGTINFAAAASVATFASGGDEVFAPGDILTIVAPVVVDASLADIGITIVTT